LRIKFQDGGEDDYAVLQPVTAASGESTQDKDGPKSCILTGSLLFESNVLVTVSGICPLDNSFEVRIQMFDKH
jgi:hypothetical protein